jgi:hypothetical protein
MVGRRGFQVQHYDDRKRGVYGRNTVATKRAKYDKKTVVYDRACMAWVRRLTDEVESWQDKTRDWKTVTETRRAEVLRLVVEVEHMLLLLDDENDRWRAWWNDREEW